MGCNLCIAADLDVSAEVYAGANSLPEDIVQINEKSDQILQDEFINIIAHSFCGTKSRPGEPSISWCYDPDSYAERSGAFVGDEPSTGRLNFYKFNMKLSLKSSIRYGGCFALRDTTSGRLLSVAVTFPPNDKELHNIGLCDIIYIIHQMGGIRSPPPEMISGNSAGRLDAFHKQLQKSHNEHAQGRHLYVVCFATAQDEQGKGYGSRLMDFLVQAANNMKVDAYLECSGEQNERFYRKHGFEVKKRYPIQYKNESFHPDGLKGFAAMVYKYNNQ